MKKLHVTKKNVIAMIMGFVLGRIIALAILAFVGWKRGKVNTNGRVLNKFNYRI